MGTTRLHWRPLAPFVLIACLVSTRPASADPFISVEDRAKAAEAYDQGTSAYLAKHYEVAAHWFEQAYRVAPTSAALLQAVRAHDKAGNVLRAANLGLELRDEYPRDTPSVRAADAMIERAARDNLLVHAVCEKQCTLELDGALIRHASFFVTPDVEHSVKASFEDGETSTTVEGAAAEETEVTLLAPAPPPPPPVPRWAFYSSLGATVALGAVTIWAGVDANRGVSEYEAAAQTANSPGINTSGSPTPAERAQALLDEGQQKERRTNILIGVTAGMAVTTAVLGVFTNWKGESREPSSKRVEAAVGATPRGGGLTIRGRF
jgi:hypothetical protein